MAESAFYVIAYDVTDDRRRLRVAKRLEAVGERVQESVFEAYLTPADLEKLLKKIAQVLNAQADSLRIYYLCSECRSKARTSGRAQVTAPPGVKII